MIKDDDKKKALDAALAQIEKQYGKGSVMKLGDSSANMNIEVIPTGSLSLDIALGLGGVPRGRIIEVFDRSPVVRPRLHYILLQRSRNVAVLQALLMQNMHWILYMRRISVSILMTSISHSRIAVNRHLRSQRQWCAPVQ